MSKAYQQTGSYIPRKEADFNAWLGNFAQLIAACPGKYGLSEQDGQVLTGLAKEFSEVYDLVQSGATRTPGLITRKDAIRASAEGTVRMYAAQIRANKGVDNQARIELGLHIADPTRTPIGRPETAPMLTIPGAFSGCHVLRCADETTPKSRKKPPGVVHMHLAMVLADSIVTDPEQATFIGNYSRQPIHIRHEPPSAGKTATYFGRWVTKRGLLGPWSLPVWMQIAFGGGMHEGAVAGDGELKIAA